MEASELIRTGHLGEARTRAVEAVKSAPADLAKRTLLVEILAFCGDWERALQQLEAISATDPARETGVKAYRDLLAAEKERLQVTRLEATPTFLPEPPPYHGAWTAARQRLAEGPAEQAEALLKGIGSGIPPVKGSINGQPFEGLTDTDSLLSFFLEAFVHDRYVLVPFEALRELALPPPRRLIDLLWAPARITAWEGLTVNGFLPVLYPETFRHADDRVKLGHMSAWVPLGAGLYRGAGQHVLQAGDTELGILEIREATFTGERPDEPSA